jgi:hypothetical protein
MINARLTNSICPIDSASTWNRYERVPVVSIYVKKALAKLRTKEKRDWLRSLLRNRESFSTSTPSFQPSHSIMKRTIPRRAPTFRPSFNPPASFLLARPSLLSLPLPYSQQHQQQQRKAFSTSHPRRDGNNEAPRSPFAVFVETLKGEIEKNRDLQENVKQLQGDVGKMQDSEQMKRAKELYEKARVRFQRSTISRGDVARGEVRGRKRRRERVRERAEEMTREAKKSGELLLE